MSSLPRSIAPRHKSPVVGVTAALGAAVIWGFAFIALKWAYEGIGPVWLTAFRFIAAFAIGLATLAASGSSRPFINRHDALLAAPAGAVLGICLLLQAIGLRLTTVANSGFITVLYAVFVPFGEVLILRRRVRPRVWLWVSVALLGSAFLTGFDPRAGLSPFASFNAGDWLTLGCAITGAAHFLAVGAIESRVRSAFATNAWQMLWAAVVTIPFAPLLEGPPSAAAFSPGVVLSLLYLVLVSTIGGFFLQIKSQQHLAPTTSGLLCLMESPFAAGFAMLLLGESLTGARAAGAAMMLVAAMAATRER